MSPQSFPAWDLNKVLTYLRSDIFEPLVLKDLRTVTMEVLFLVLLASAKRVSELHALSRVVSTQGNDLVLSYVNSFIAKSETVSNPIPRYFQLKSLWEIAGNMEEEMILCPVRALRIYSEKTSSLPDRPNVLFVSPKRPLRSISKNALSFFLRK